MDQTLFREFADRAQRADTVDDLKSEVRRLRDSLGLQHLIYHLANLESQVFGAGTYRPEWTEHYVKESYFRIDPVLQGVSRGFHPVDWRRLERKTDAVRDFWNEATKEGIGPFGVSIPIRGPAGQFALFSATLDGSEAGWDAYCGDNMRDLLLAGHMINQRALEIADLEAADQPVTLSPRETDALTYLAMGYARSQVSETLGISEHTLRVYIESARSKLKAANTVHAIAKAVSMELLPI